MYIDSEIEVDYSYRFLKDSASKQPINQILIAKPLQDDNKATVNYKKTSDKFYGQVASDNEKVIICSVINSARQEGGDNIQSHV